APAALASARVVQAAQAVQVTTSAAVAPAEWAALEAAAALASARVEWAVPAVQEATAALAVRVEQEGAAALAVPEFPVAQEGLADHWGRAGSTAPMVTTADLTGAGRPALLAGPAARVAWVAWVAAQPMSGTIRGAGGSGGSGGAGEAGAAALPETWVVHGRARRWFR
ncbi:MAG: hypothetical protein KC432_02550, partial [Thermomicrobiales bacterium]|nr:hypothetical protein [Thermomicrobiales bacterium]